MKTCKEDGWNEFLHICASLRSPEQLQAFFDLFLTIEERRTLGARYLIVKALLEKQETQREIARLKKVSIAQITRGSNALKTADLRLKKHIKQQMNISS